MRIKLFSLIFGFFTLIVQSIAQFQEFKVLDAETKKPLNFATIEYGIPIKTTFSDSSGSFYVSKSSINQGDSIQIYYIGYQPLFQKLGNNQNGIFYLVKTQQVLDEVFVKNCNNSELIAIGKNQKKNSRFGVAPFVRMVWSSYFPNENKQVGYLSTLSFPLKFRFNDPAKLAPVRLHWYSYNFNTKKIDKELTDTIILLKPYKNGINTFTLPERSIFFDTNGIVLGFEFLYTHEQELAYLQSKKDSNFHWMHDNSWYFWIGKTSQEEGFRIPTPFKEYVFPTTSKFLNSKELTNYKVIMNFTVKICN